MYSLMKPGIKIGCYDSFKKRVIEVFDKLIDEMNERCECAQSIVLVVDAWSDSSMQSFPALGAYLESGSFESELVVLGMEQLLNGSKVKEIKVEIEKIINKYTTICPANQRHSKFRASRHF